jgi:hypothetical protein
LVEVAVTGNGIAIFFIFRGTSFITGVTRGQQAWYTMTGALTGAVIRGSKCRHVTVAGVVAVTVPRTHHLIICALRVVAAHPTEFLDATIAW